MEDEILFTIDKDNIAQLTFNRPQVHNAFNEEMLQKLIEVIKTLRENPLPRALVIRGNGESFCAGADLSWMKSGTEYSENKNYDEARLLSQMLYFLDTLPIPTITYAHGAVMGGGIGILACSDIAIADSQTIFSFSETRLGLIPAVISPFVLRAMPVRYARRYFITGEKFDALTAQTIGIIHKAVASDNADPEINKFIRTILAGGPQAVKEAKRLLHQMTGDIPEATRLSTIESITNVRRSEEGQQGVKAFFDKTTPPWVSDKPPDA